MDCCANSNGNNAHCKKFYSAENSVFNNTVVGEVSWWNPPFSHAEMFMQKYAEDKKKSPHDTSAAFVLLAYKLKDCLQYIKGMQLVHIFPAGSRIFSAPGMQGASRRNLPGTPWDTFVFWDGPAPRMSAASTALPSKPGLAMLFDAQCRGMSCTVLADTGASGYGFISMQFCINNNIPDSTMKGTVQSFTDKQESAAGEVQVRVKIGAYSKKVTLVGVDMSKEFDIIMGERWLKDEHALLDMQKNCMVLRKGKPPTES